MNPECPHPSDSTRFLKRPYANIRGMRTFEDGTRPSLEVIKTNRKMIKTNRGCAARAARVSLELREENRVSNPGPLGHPSKTFSTRVRIHIGGVAAEMSANIAPISLDYLYPH